MINPLKKIKSAFFMRLLGFLQLLGFLALFLSIFIWIWYGWTLAWKVGLSAIVTIIISGIVWNFILNTAKKLLK